MRSFPCRPRLLAAAALAVLFCSAEAAAQSTASTVLDLRVIETETGRPVADAIVRVAGVRAPVWTDASGRARIGQVPEGRRRVTIERAGFAVERLTIGFGSEPVEGEVELEVLPVTLAPVEVVARQERDALRQRGFYTRLRQGQGSFVTREEIERMRPVQTIDIFRRMRGVRVAMTPQGRPMLMTARGSGSLGRDCVPLVYLDGALLNTDSSRVDPGDVIQPHHIEAIETYAGPATIPPELNITGSACGVVAIWSRFG